MSDSNVTRKIIRSLLKICQLKVMDNLKFDELIGNLKTDKVNRNKKTKSKGIALNIKTKSNEINIDFESDHEVAVKFHKSYNKYFLNKNLANDSTTYSKKKPTLKNKTQANKIKIKRDKKNSKKKPSGFQCSEYSMYGHYAHKYANRKK